MASKPNGHFIRRKNSFMQPNAVANMPHYIESLPKLNHPLHITTLSGKTIKEQTKIAVIECNNDAQSVLGAILVILKKEKINIPIECFRFGWSTSSKDPSHTIYEYDCTTVDWNSIEVFTLIQHTEQSNDNNNSSAKPTKSNQQEYDLNNVSMKQADQILHETLGNEIYCKLKRNARLWTSCKYNVSIKKKK